ncbi:hypothetical protein NLJ89_g3310 [Agrocybe chaxingu]|uniref:Uncharacterized protein n=1 Tax=Agrocybe chaxingu TaxID=84603 RepID=A0A9W8K2P5_9AGAR|nr:hypothetical protein NLJ89_g3310 [Agrocybe chaxingu]
MAERNISRPWSEEEDRQLREAVGQFGEHDNWKTIALHRWLHSLQPSVKKSAWTPNEDEQLLTLYKEHGPKWSLIARSIPGRTDDACSKRYRESLDPNLKKDQWTPEEDAKLVEVYGRLGGKWGQVGQELQRSGLGCRNRWRLLERKSKSRVSQHSSPITFSIQEMPPPVQATSCNSLPPEEQVPSQTLWPPYYPPEAYPTFPIDDEPRIGHQFREPTPEKLDLPDPQVAPFKFSSSSLSAALSGPPRAHPPLPPVSAFNTPELLVHDSLHDSERQPSLSPLSQCNGMPEMNDVFMSLGDCQQTMEQLRTTDVAITQSPYVSSSGRLNILGLHTMEYAPYYSASPISFAMDINRPFESPFIENSQWKVRNMSYESDVDNSPRSVLDGLTVWNEGHDDQSSASSTPYNFSTPLSPTASPNPISPVDLPAVDNLATGSLLFAPPDSRGPGLIRRGRKTSRRTKPSIKLAVTTRLSSQLPLSNDPNMRPYACGRSSCWPIGQETSSHCFATSGELLDHTKDDHTEEEPSEKPFRCALPGCGKSWKSINGLQYHLQISAAHFTHALFSRFAQQPATPDQQTSSLSTDGEVDASDPDRKYMCPREGCFKAYRQPSGLRYHIKHGHPTDIPAQLPLVPPALERQIPTKAKKLRAKPVFEVPAPLAS